MSGISFQYAPGRLEARFEQGHEVDYVELSLRMVGDVTTTQEDGDDGQEGAPVANEAPTVEVFAYVSSVFCPFEDFIRFLEAITIDVQECGFTWDAEGPAGSMRWERRRLRDTGFLTVEWDSRQGSIANRTMLDTRQVVEALYTAFREFVDSPGYDPLRYERVKLGDSVSLVVAGASAEDVTQRMVHLDAVRASQVLTRLVRAARGRSEHGPKTVRPIDHFFDLEEFHAAATEQSPDVWLVKAGWDAGNEARRREILDEEFSSGVTSWSGANLRELRSHVIEDWLSAPWPAVRR